jgi:osmoprotectant transport system substrate-binding protein
MKKLMVILVAMTVLLVGCAGGGGSSGGGDGVIRVGSKDFTEQLILGQIAIKALEANGITVVDSTNIAGTENVRAALDSGEIDLYWEYTGTAWMMLMGQELVPGDTPAQLFERVRDRDVPNDIVWLNFAPLNNTYALAITSEMSQAYGLHSLSDLAAHMAGFPDQLLLATEHEFLVRPDGLPGMMETYGFPEFDVRTMLVGIVYGTLAAGQADVGVVHGTDGRIPYHNLVVLEDNLNFFPIYSPAPTIRADSLERFPQIADILNPIAALLTDEVAQGLNFLVDSGEMEPDEVAEFWLRSEGFID